MNIDNWFNSFQINYYQLQHLFIRISKVKCPIKLKYVSSAVIFFNHNLFEIRHLIKKNEKPQMLLMTYNINDPPHDCLSDMEKLYLKFIDSLN